MTTDTAERTAGSPVTPAITRSGVTFPRVVRSEWIKFRTLRSSWITLFAAFAGMIAIDVLVGYNTGKNFAGLAPEDSAPSGPLQGYYLGQLLIGVLGVLFVSGEYSTGMIRSTLAAVPTRIPVLLAKSLVFGTIALITMVVGTFAGFLGAQVFLSHYGHGSSLSDPTVLRVIIGTAVYLALVGLLGGALGWIVRSTPGGISTLLGLLLVVPVLLEVLPGAWVQDVGHYLPSQAGASFVSSVQVPGALSPLAGLLVMLTWVVAALIAAAVLLRRRDG